MKMKRVVYILAIVLVVSCVLLSLCACDGGGDGKLSVVVTIFPEYDWVKTIMGERFESADVTLLLDNGVDLHNYQPSAEDIIKISSADVFIYVGGESDGWVDDVLRTALDPDMVVINLMDTLGDSVIDAEHGHEHEGEHDEHDHEGDEHVWLSLKNAKAACTSIASALSAVDPDGAEVYAANLASYVLELDALDGEYREAVASASKNAILFADRFPFAYLAHDYGLEHYAAFSGCSSESEASFEIIVELAGKIDELGLDAILVTEGADTSIAETVIAATANKNARILRIDSMQSTTLADAQNGKSYIKIMRDNLAVLIEALG